MKKISKSQIKDMVEEQALDDFKDGIKHPDDFKARDFFEKHNQFKDFFSRIDFSAVSKEEVKQWYIDHLDLLQLTKKEL